MVKLSSIRLPPRYATILTVVGLTALYLIVRVAILGRSFDPMWDEERAFGLLPDHMLTGLIVPYLDYLTLAREGGSLLVGPPYAAVYAFFGSTFYSLRLCNVLFHAVTMVVFCLTAASVTGWRGAAVFGLLWCLAPPGLVNLQQAGWFNHLEACLPAGLALLLLAASLRAADHRWSWGIACLSGLSAGLAVFCAYSALPHLGALLLVALIALRRHVSIRRPAFVLGTALGFVPTIAVRALYMDVATDWQRAGGNIFLYMVQETPESALVLHVPLGARIGALLTEHWHDLLKFSIVDWVCGGAVVDAAYLACIGGLAVISVAAFLGNRLTFVRIRRGRPTVAEAIVLTAVLTFLMYLLVYLSSGFGGSGTNRYLAPLFPYLLLLSACSLPSRVQDDPRTWSMIGKIPILVMIGVAVAVGGLGANKLYQSGRERGHFDRVLKGYHLIHVASAFGHRSLEDRMDAARTHVQDRVELLRMIGYQESNELLSADVGDAIWSQANEQSAELPTCAAAYYWEGVGLSLAERAFDPEARPAVLETVKQRNGPHLDEDALAFGLGNGFVREHYGNLDDVWPRLQESLPEDLRHSMCLGLGAADLRQRNLWAAPAAARGDLGDCRFETYATGMGIQLGRELFRPDTLPDETPRAIWWLKADLAPAGQAPMVEGFVAEAARVAAVAACPWENRK